MNAFLFNMGMFIMTTYAVMQFSQQAFADYTRLTSLSSMSRSD